ncbi:unnamed protein product [Closterium sp. NIES-54]
MSHTHTLFSVPFPPLPYLPLPSSLHPHLPARLVLVLGAQTNMAFAPGASPLPYSRLPYLRLLSPPTLPPPTLPYPPVRLVLALGAQTNMAFAPGAKGRALPFSTLDDALAVDRRLLLLEKRWQAAKEAGDDPPPIRVVVVGAGYAGVELACTVGERLGSKGSIEIVDPAAAVCPAAAPGNRRAAERVCFFRSLHHKSPLLHFPLFPRGLSISPSLLCAPP